jgi:colicin import membrane protein
MTHPRCGFAASPSRGQRRRPGRAGSAAFAWSLAAVLGLGGSAAHGADERARIATERAQVEKIYDAQYRECQSGFVVTACVDSAKAQRRAALEQLAQQQAILDDADRRQRAAQRAQQIHEKLAQSAPHAPHVAASAAALPLQIRAPRVQRAAHGAASAPRAAGSAAFSEAQRAHNREEFERHQQEAAGHREELERRAVDRASKRDRPPTALPAAPQIPASSAGS